MKVYCVIMERDYCPDFEEDDLGCNPYCETLSLKVMAYSGKRLYDQEGNEVDTKREFEQSPYVKIFGTSESRKRVASMPLRSQALLFWIAHELKSMRDYLWIPRGRCMQEQGISSIKTFRASINDLKWNGFIRETAVRDVYWINPSFFFKGSRLNKWPDKKEYVYGGSKKGEDDN